LVVAETQKSRLAHVAARIPVLVTDLAYQDRLDPGVRRAARHVADAGRLWATQRLQARVNVDQVLLREPGADLAGVLERAAIPDPDVERREAGARGPLRGRVPDHDEVAGALDADLEPIRESAASVRRVGLLGHDAFEAARRNLFEQGHALLVDVRGQPERTD